MYVHTYMCMYVCTFAKLDASPNGQSLNIIVLDALPDPWAFNYCMHTFPENTHGHVMV